MDSMDYSFNLDLITITGLITGKTHNFTLLVSVSKYLITTECLCMQQKQTYTHIFLEIHPMRFNDFSLAWLHSQFSSFSKNDLPSSLASHTMKHAMLRTTD